MRRLLPFLLVLVGLCSACSAPGQLSGSHSGSQQDAGEPEDGSAAEAWELICDWYEPVYTEHCKAISFPMFDGMTKEMFEARALDLGYDFEAGLYFFWATGGEYSPQGRYFAYQSNKDCLEPVRGDAFSVFLLDMYSGKERVLLSGSDGGYYNIRGWLDEETLLCFNGTEDGEEYFSCGVDGSVKPLGALFESNWGQWGRQGRLLVEQVGQELRILRIETDGSVTEVSRAAFEGDSINSCGISPDGAYACYTLQRDRMSGERFVILWDTASGKMTELECPEMTDGKDGAAINVHWTEGGFAVNFYVSDAPDQNGHNELWLYRMNDAGQHSVAAAE